MDERLLEDLAKSYASARRSDRPQLLTDFCERLFSLGETADRKVTSARIYLEQIGDPLHFVLTGTLQQQVACKLAKRLGYPRARALPKSVRDLVVLPLIPALIEVLRLGAPTTRDAAVEGLGALLKLAGDYETHFPSEKPLAVELEENEDPATHALRQKISDQYFARLDRRRLLVLTIAGHAKSRATFIESLKESIEHKVARLRYETDSWEKIEHALNVQSDLLRILPAMARQGQKLPDDATGQLCAAARLRTIAEDAPPDTLVALARFHESVFRTIDAAMRRAPHWKWQDFDEVVAAAVHTIPQSIGGPASVCNGQIRATVAILRTAIRLVVASGGASRTKDAIAPLFQDVGKHMRWSNLGIVEGCYRGLPQLITEPAHNDLTGPLETLFTQLRHPHKSEELVDIHRHLIANACFRRMLILVSERGRHGDAVAAAKVEQQLRLLLREPTPENILRICQRDEEVKGWPTAVMPSDASHTIIAGIAFEAELLSRGASMFERWDERLTVEKVLLTRILAAQLHAISRDAPVMQRNSALKLIFSGIDTISTTDETTMNKTWSLLSSLPPDAAESADAEIQRFVEYRGWGRDDLPGYVLAMISPAASGRIAGAIAREIDLNLHRDRLDGKSCDFAKSLHQVMLRGPHQSIFDHLLPRFHDDGDRALVRLFRKHVASVLHARQSGDLFDLTEMRTHVKALLADLEGQTSPTLIKLREAFELFVRLTANEMAVWVSLKTDVTTLFTVLDELAADDDYRTPLFATFRDELAKLQEEVKDYVAKPIGDFTGRRKALTKAGKRAATIEKSLRNHKGLQPPERSLLIALMHHFQDLFASTIGFSCDTARRFRDANDQKSFWRYFCDENSQAIRIAEARKQKPESEREHAVEQIRNEPPFFRMQREKSEEYYVEWMSSELDVDSLRNVLCKRWPRWFRFVYAVITNFWWTSLLILAPCAVAIFDDWMGFHAWEGIGFFVLTSGLIVTAMLSFTQIIHVLAKWWRSKNKERLKPGYWFPCLMPRLARLTAVPMALIVEFDHSYEFPLAGSTWALLLLMVTSFVTTRFFVTREMVDRKEQPGVVKITKPERRRVRQIVGLALAHSFGIAVLLSAIFAPSYERRHGPEKPVVHHEAVPATSFWARPVAALDYLDATSKRHPGRRFIGLIPREVSFDLGEIVHSWGYSLPARIREIVGFRFYPTIILAWTALGLFFGVFLEGFMGGKRLRGGWPGGES